MRDLVQIYFAVSEKWLKSVANSLPIIFLAGSYKWRGWEDPETESVQSAGFLLLDHPV